MPLVVLYIEPPKNTPQLKELDAGYPESNENS